MKKSGIYRIVNITNGKLYVGSAVNFNGRWRSHKSLLNKNKHHSSYLQNSWNICGKDSFHFEIIEECEPVKEILETREQYYIDTLKPEYNMCQIVGTTLGMKHSEQTKQKLSAASKKRFENSENHPMFGKTGENCPNFGKHHSEVSKQKMSEAKRGENSSSAILNWNIVREIRSRYKEENITMKQLGIEYGVSKGCIQCIIENRNWKEKEEENS